MAVFEGSRYEGLPYIGIRYPSGITKRFLGARRPLSRNDIVGEFDVHRVEAGEVLDLLAYQYYGDENLWHLIAEVNDLFFAYDLTPGMELIIPPRDLADTPKSFYE